jgi:hypothetical protein
MPGISAQFVLLTLHLEVAWVYKELCNPTCRWIAKRISLLESMAEQNSYIFYEIFHQERSKFQRNWNSQSCFFGIS